METIEDKPPPPPANDTTPQYWDLLSEQDKAQYTQLKLDFSAGSTKRVRNSRLETFDGILDTIRTFAERGDDNDWRRFLVCGVCWLDNAIAINTRQLRLLVSKCKSSINGSLQKMGYTTNMSHSESWKILFPHIPLLKDHFSELRQWTIRYKTGAQGHNDAENQGQNNNTANNSVNNNPPSNGNNQTNKVANIGQTKKSRAHNTNNNANNMHQIIANTSTLIPQQMPPRLNAEKQIQLKQIDIPPEAQRRPSMPLKFRARMNLLQHGNANIP